MIAGVTTKLLTAANLRRWISASSRVIRPMRWALTIAPSEPIGVSPRAFAAWRTARSSVTSTSTSSFEHSSRLSPGAMEFLEPLLRGELLHLLAQKGVPVGVTELGVDRGRPLRLQPDALGYVKLVEDREKREAADLCEMDQGTRIDDGR